MLPIALKVPPSVATLVDILRWRALNQPAQIAYKFLLDGETEEAQITYAELDRRARAIGALLQSHGTVGDRALLLYPPGLDYIATFFGCLYAGILAVPAYPPRRNRSIGRLQAIVVDARATLVLTTAQLLTSLHVPGRESTGLESLCWLATDQLDDGLADTWSEVAAGPDTLAFLQYTSGSTGTPKGVMVSHGNLIHNSAQIHDKFGITAETRPVVWLPPYHDMGLVGGIIEPLFGGFSIQLMSPVDFLQRPLRWLQAMSRIRGTISGGPNFAYDLCARKIGPEERVGLDLSQWECAFVGAEPIRPEVLDRFAAAFEPCGFRREAFYPCYGLAEATLIATGGKLHVPPVIRSFQSSALTLNRVVAVPEGSEGSQTLVGSGDAAADQEIVIVHPETATLCQADEIGEVWIAGPSVAKGYWNQPELTKRDFQAYLADGSAGPFLRTGDLGAFLDGELFITGRIKDLIIIRGRNHYPQDIEATVDDSHPAVRVGSGAAFSVDVDGAEQLIIVCEVDREHRHPNVREIAGAIRESVGEHHGLYVYDVVLIKHASIPKTSSGKIQRHACRAGYLAGELDVIGRVGPESEQPKAAHTDRVITGENLTRDVLLSLREGERPVALITYLQHVVAPLAEVAVSEVSVQKPLVGLGLDSLAAVELCSRVETDLGVIITLDDIDANVSIFQVTMMILDRIPPPVS